MEKKRGFRIGRLLYPLGILLAIVAGIFIGLPLGHSGSLGASLAEDRSCDVEFALLNPQLRCERVENKKKEYTVFKEQLETYIKDKKASGVIKSVAVYFRDLENGPWFGIEEDALFSPASMLKLPVLIAYYKNAESDPEILGQEIGISASASSEDNSYETQSLQIGGSYTIDELLRRMIILSDNTALHILLSYLKKAHPEGDLFAETLAAMGVAKSEGSEKDFLTVKRYSSFYRALYNASFLSKETSQRALDLLTRTASPTGIDQGVPDGVTVAHKFGIRENEGQYHDCGIVYDEQNPYILCIMTRGTDIMNNTAVIQEISRMVYEEVESRN